MDAQCPIAGQDSLVERLQNEISALLEELKESQQREQKYWEVDAANSKLRKALEESLNNELDGLKLENKDMRAKLNRCYAAMPLHSSPEQLLQLQSQEPQQAPQQPPQQEPEIVKLQSTLDEQKQKIVWLQNENKDVHEELMQFEKKIPYYRNLEIVNNELQGSLDAQREQNEWLQGKNQEYEIELKHCKKKIQQYRKLESANEELQSLLHARENRLKNLKNENKQLHVELEQLGKTDQNRMILEKDHQNDELELDNHKLKLSNIELQCALDAQEQKLDSLHNESKNLLVELKLSQEKIESIDILKMTTMELRSQLDAHDRQLTNLEQEKHNMHIEVKQYFEQFDLTARKLMEFGIHKSSQNTMLELQETLNAQKEYISELLKDNNNLQTELEHVHKELDKFVNQQTLLQKHNDAINYRMRKIDEILKEENTELNGNDQQEGQMKNENRRLRLEIGRLNELIVHFNRHSSQSEDQLQHSLSSQCSTLDSEDDCALWSWHHVIRELVS